MSDIIINFHLNTLLAISMAECLVANKILYCIVSYCIIVLEKGEVYSTIKLLY